MRRALFALVLLVASCGRKAPDATPEGALDEFLRAAEESAHDPAALSQAYALLAPSSRHALEERARRASAVTGKRMTPEQMFVPAFTPLRFEVAKTKALVAPDGRRATVDVYGPDPATQHAKVPMELEGEGWRVALPIEP